MAATFPSLNIPSPQERTNVPLLSNSISGCAPRCSTRMLPRCVTATDATWMKFQAPGIPAAVVGGAGHSTSSYGRPGISALTAAGPTACWPCRGSARRRAATKTNARICFLFVMQPPSAWISHLRAAVKFSMSGPTLGLAGILRQRAGSWGASPFTLACPSREGSCGAQRRLWVK